MTTDLATSVLIACDHAPVPPALRQRQQWDHDVALSTDATQGRVNLRIDALDGKVLGNVNARAADLVRIATFCAAADQVIDRGTRRIDVHRARWRRHFVLCIPVSEPAFWSMPESLAALGEVLAFATEDTWEFAFSEQAPAQRQLVLNHIDERALRGDPDTVILFSGGMDSLCATVDVLEQGGRRPLVVSHRSAPQIGRWQLDLLDAVRVRYPQWGLPHISFWIHRQGSPESDPSQRTRGFLFAALGSAVAAGLQVERVLLADNGYVSINPPISGELVGALASRGTHPTLLRLMNRLNGIVFDSQIQLENPLAEQTRAEALADLARHGHADLLPLTRTCGKHRGRPRSVPHCGGCSQCVDRRFAVLATRLEDLEPASQYGVDIFTATLPEGEPRKVALSFVDFAQAVREAADAEEVVRTTPELIACLDPDAPNAPVAMARLAAVLQRHADEVIAVLERMIVRHSSDLARGTLPVECLLRLITGPAHIRSPGVDAGTGERRGLPADHDADGMEESRPSLTRAGHVWHLEFEGQKASLPHRKGLQYLARLLKAPGQELLALDLVSNASPDTSRRVSTSIDRDEADRFSQSVPSDALLDRTARQEFERRATEIRDELEEEFLSDERRDVLLHDLEAIAQALQTARGKGGRLRRFNDEHEKARSAVTKTIGKTLEILQVEHPSLHSHLNASLSRGKVWCYDPHPRIKWDVTL